MQVEYSSSTKNMNQKLVKYSQFACANKFRVYTNKCQYKLYYNTYNPLVLLNTMGKTNVNNAKLIDNQ